jgi:hypothetical protein
MKRSRDTALSVGLVLLALLALSAAAGAAKPQPIAVKQTTKPILTLAMDGPRAAYMRSDRRVYVWNVATGGTSVVKGDYPSKGRKFGHGTGEVAIAGKRVALITRFVIGNSQQTQERLYTAPVGGSARQIGSLTNHVTDPPDCEAGDSGFSSGNWIAGVVGSGDVLAVSTWRATGQSVPSHERLSLVTPTGLRTIATGAGTIVAQSASGGRIAVLDSTQAWPPVGDVGPPTASSPVVIYSAEGALLGGITLSTPLSSGCYYPATILRVALSGNRLVVLTLAIPEAGALTSTLEVYDWTTGTLVHVWPLALPHGSPGSDRVSVSGRLAVIEGDAFRLRLLDLTTGKAATISGSRAGSPATIGPRGLVYAVNPYKAGRPGKLVFVPTAKLLASVS